MKKAIWIIFVVLLIVAGFGLKTYRDAGEFRKIQPHGGEACKIVGGVLSSEDITIDPHTGMAFISSDDRRPWFAGKEGAQGAIVGYQLTDSAAVPTPIPMTYLGEFHPHGIGLLKAGDRTSLFVVNHRSDGQFVEIFDFDGQQLLHRRSVQGDLMTSPNDVIPVGEEQFYVTNDHGSTHGLGKTLEEYLQLARSYVLYFDGLSFRKVAKGLAYANGINLSPDGKTVYVAATVSQAIFVYDRDLQSGNLTLRQRIDVHTGADNVEVDSTGNLWIGAHPRLLTFVKYAKDSTRRSPSQVLRVRWLSYGNYEIDDIYMNDGNPLSGSSVAAVFRNQLLVGSVFDRKFLVCRVK